MARPVQVQSSDAASTGTAPVPGVTGMQVCPFCGAIGETSNKPCRRCAMENTSMTRQATRSRIGPWYVLQTRNPSVPGMKFSTMLTLIRGGQVSARSVIRGPTSHQLWRFASRVKGVSREFGLCYSCGGTLERTANVCPYCSRPQDLPANPDLLLEAEVGQNKAVYLEAKSHDDAATERPGSAPSAPPPSSAPPLRPAHPGLISQAVSLAPELPRFNEPVRSQNPPAPPAPLEQPVAASSGVGPSEVGLDAAGLAVPPPQTNAGARRPSQVKDRVLSCAGICAGVQFGI